MWAVVHSAQVVGHGVPFPWDVSQHEVELQDPVDVFAQGWWQRLCLQEARQCNVVGQHDHWFLYDSPENVCE